MAPSVFRPGQMLIFNPSMCYVEQRQQQASMDNCIAVDNGGRRSVSPCTSVGSNSNSAVSSPPTKRTYVKNISPEEKILRKKLRNREAAQLSRDKKKAQFNILSGMVHGLRKENVHLKEEIETLRASQEQLLAENERLREQLAAESSVTKTVATKESCTTEANDRISIEGPAVSRRHPLQKGKRNRTSCLTLCYRILFLLLTTLSYMTLSYPMMTIWTGLTSTYQNVWRRLPMNYLEKVSSMNVVLMKWWGAHQKSWNPAKILIYLV